MELHPIAVLTTFELSHDNFFAGFSLEHGICYPINAEARKLNPSCGLPQIGTEHFVC
jgi:hypothetical protein